MFEVNKDYYPNNPYNYEDWNKHPITVFKRTNKYIWVYHKHTLKPNENITTDKCGRFKTFNTIGGKEGIKIRDAYFYA
jgi:hypothetical protein